jgi:hypothetical protein
MPGRHGKSAVATHAGPLQPVATSRALHSNLTRSLVKCVLSPILNSDSFDYFILYCLHALKASCRRHAGAVWLQVVDGAVRLCSAWQSPRQAPSCEAACWPHTPLKAPHTCMGHRLGPQSCLKGEPHPPESLWYVLHGSTMWGREAALKQYVLDVHVVVACAQMLHPPCKIP